MKVMYLTSELILEIGLNEDIKFLDRKKNPKKSFADQPNHFFWHVTLNRGTFFNLTNNMDKVYQDIFIINIKVHIFIVYAVLLHFFSRKSHSSK